MTDRERFEGWAGGTIGRLGRSTEPGYTHQYEDSHTQMAWVAWDAAAKAEREACEDICDAMQKCGPNSAGLAADRIRRRSNNESNRLAATNVTEGDKS